jgi:hypothetical protein
LFAGPSRGGQQARRGSHDAPAKRSHGQEPTGRRPVSCSPAPTGTRLPPLRVLPHLLAYSLCPVPYCVRRELENSFQHLPVFHTVPVLTSALLTEQDTFLLLDQYSPSPRRHPFSLQETGPSHGHWLGSPSIPPWHGGFCVLDWADLHKHRPWSLKSKLNGRRGASHTPLPSHGFCL